jgi:hypothetical protein
MSEGMSSVLWLTDEQFKKLCADPRFDRVPGTHEALFTGTLRQDVLDDTKGGQHLTKKGKPRKRVKNISSRVIL